MKKIRSTHKSVLMNRYNLFKDKIINDNLHIILLSYNKMSIK